MKNFNNINFDNIAKKNCNLETLCMASITKQAIQQKLQSENITLKQFVDLYVVAGQVNLKLYKDLLNQYSKDFKRQLNNGSKKLIYRTPSYSDICNVYNVMIYKRKKYQRKQKGLLKIII
jgi:hypothetical protein